MKLNSELDAEVRAKIDRGWEVHAGLYPTDEWLLVCQRGGPPFGPDDMVDVYRNGVVEGVDLDDITAAKPHKHAPVYKFGEPDTVTRDEAKEMACKGWQQYRVRTGICETLSHWTTVEGSNLKYATHIKSPGGNVWKLEEK